MTEREITKSEVEAAATALIAEMFAPHELPVDEELWWKYVSAARAALLAARAVKR